MPIDEEILIQYALGILDGREDKAVQQEITASPALQKELASIHNALQHVALAEKPLSPSERLRNLVLDSTREKTRYNGFIERFSDLFDLDKLTSKNLLSKIDHVSDNDWESTLFSGVNIMKFAGGPRVASATCGIVQVKPGKLFPAHQHQGEESLFVLKGVARDDAAREFSAGDMLLFSAGSQHSFRILGDETFVFAVVLQKKNKWLLFKTLIDHFRIKN